MKSWERKKLGDVCGFVRGPFGGSLKKNIFKPEGYAVYEQQHAIYDQFDHIRYFIDENKFNEMKRFELNSGDLIMSCSGTMGKIAIVPENIKKGIINQALLKLTPSKKVSTVFLKLWMQSESFQESLREYSGGAAIQNVASVATLKRIEIPLPPLLEQQRIVAILDEAFAAIAKAKANAEQNLKNAKELFESYLQGVFEKKGDGWEERKLGEVAEYDKNQNIHLGLPYVGLEHIESNSGRFIGSLASQEVKSSTFYFDKQHVLYGRLRPYLNKVLLPDFKGHCSTEIFPIKVNGQVAREFLFYWLIAVSTVKKIDATWTGARMPRANMNQVLEFDFAFPSLKEQQTIVRQLGALRAETQKLEAVYQQKIADLEELKKSILQKVFAGELKMDSIKVAQTV
ncbi:MAG: restriction endonuclease subunit S [Bacteroidota bacterium]|nr:restriction endonuclease subunit S [Bacteroidota bacterium]